MLIETNGSKHAVGGRQSTKPPVPWLQDAAPHAGYIDPTITRPSALDTLSPRFLLILPSDPGLRPLVWHLSCNWSMHFFG
jgi:hypothetical protein